MYAWQALCLALFVGMGLWGLGSRCLPVMQLLQTECTGGALHLDSGRVLQSHLAKKGGRWGRGTTTGNKNGVYHNLWKRNCKIKSPFPGGMLGKNV